MSVRLGDLAERSDCELRGDPDVEVTGVATLARAGPGEISFLANPAYREFLAETRAAAVILAEKDADRCPVSALISDNPYLAYAHVAAVLHPQPPFQAGISERATVDSSASVAPSAWIGAGSVIESGAVIGEDSFVGPGCTIGSNAVIGADCRLVARVTLCGDVTIGDRVLVHPGAVIGADGFGIARDGDRWVKVPQLGSVSIGNDVEIGANTTIDRGAIENTVLESGVKLDNQIQIGHNVRIGEHTVIAGCVGISGSTVIGRRCMIAGASGIGGHIQIADDVILLAASVVTSSISEPGTYGSALMHDEARAWRRNITRFRHLDEMARRLRRVERRLGATDGDKENPNG
ncbi:MAG: UDP-3-O-(3-hydroxymyristoyl)glucosamine N-acyltransferase [Gammaproteobacteria bacterium]